MVAGSWIGCITLEGGAKVARLNGGNKKALLRILGLTCLLGATVTSFWDVGGPRYLPFMLFSLAVFLEWAVHRNTPPAPRKK